MIRGPDLNLNADAAQALTMVLHELTTNVVKHGALSVREGRGYIDIAMERPEDDQSVVEISWREEDGPPSLSRATGAAGWR